MASANSMSKTALPIAARLTCQPVNNIRPKVVSRIVAVMAIAGMAAAGRYQFTLPAYLTNPAQPLPYEPHKPRRPATDDRNAVASARRNPVSAIGRNRSALALSILMGLVDLPGRGGSIRTSDSLRPRLVHRWKKS